MPLGGPCWAGTYDELRLEPSCDPDFWPLTYAELVTGPLDTTEWECWVYVYDTLAGGPFCLDEGVPTAEAKPTECPTHWARVSTGGAWQIFDAPESDWADGLLQCPLMHNCSLPWGHLEAHYCGCTADYPKPGDEGWVTPPIETVDPYTDGILPVGPLPTMPGGFIAAAHQVRIPKADINDLSRRLDGAAVE
jgi:hypothetical protein